MPGRDIVVVGASAGGVEALTSLVRHLPADAPLSVFVVLHIPAHSASALPQILDRAGPLSAAAARHGEPITPGRVYVAPPDRHLLVRRGRVEVVRGPRENGHRPAVDPLFRSAAYTYGPRVAGVVLSGTLDDGTAGMIAIKQRGGIAVVQDPATAAFSSMPVSVIENAPVDHCLAPGAIGPLLARLVHEPIDAPVEDGMGERMEREIESVEMDPREMHQHSPPGAPSGFTCPECHGALWELRDGELVRYRCRVGHAYSPDSLLADQSESLEAALWAALRALEEQASLARRLTARAREQGHNLSADRFATQAEDAESRAEMIRSVLVNGKGIDAQETYSVPDRTSGSSAVS